MEEHGDAPGGLGTGELLLAAWLTSNLRAAIKTPAWIKSGRVLLLNVGVTRLETWCDVGAPSISLLLLFHCYLEMVPLPGLVPPWLMFFFCAVNRA